MKNTVCLAEKCISVIEIRLYFKFKLDNGLFDNLKGFKHLHQYGDQANMGSTSTILKPDEIFRTRVLVKGKHENVANGSIVKH